MKATHLALLLCVAAVAHGESLRIGTVTIVPLDVYSSDEARQGWIYRMADRLHIETRRPVIETFLLFKPGDEYRPERLAETERNLRALHFLKSASVVASAPHDGVVDVTVTTQDSWSVAPETQLGSKGGTTTFGANLSENNLLGLGKDVALEWDKGLDRTRVGANYNDPAFFGPYWKAQFGYAINSDGHDHRFIVSRPFYSFATRWATELSFTGFRQDDRLYAGGLEHERFRERQRQILASYGMALRATDSAATRLTAGIRVVDSEFSLLANHPTSVLPTTREFRYLFLRLEHARNDFVKLNFVNKDTRYEDFNLGRVASIEAAVSPRGLGAERTTQFARVTACEGLRTGDDGFVLGSIGASSRFEGGPANTIATSSLLAVRRTEGGHPRALVGRISLSSGWRMDRDLQFFADGITGLRGYRAHTFAGSRAVVINLEQRFYLGREVLQLASPGVVVFFDAGNATYGGAGDLMRLKADAGFGIRIGLPRTPKNLLRIDFAYAMNPDPLGRRGLLVSFSSGQAF